MLAVHGGAQTPQIRDHQRIVESVMSRLADDHPPLRPMATVLWALSTGPAADDIALQERLMGQDPWSQALRHFGWGYIALYEGDVARAEEEFDTGIEAFRAIGDRWGLAGLLAARARLAGWRGDDERSLALAGEALELVRRLGAAEDTADLLCLRAENLARAGDFDQARGCYERAGEYARRSGAPETVAQVLHGLGELARLSGDLAEARLQYDAALGVCTTEAFSVTEIRLRVLVGLGRTAETEGDIDGARALFRQALGDSSLPTVADVAEGLAGLALSDDDGERAALLLGAGCALRGISVAGDHDVARVALRARELIGDAAYVSAFERGAALPREEARALVDPS